MPRLLIPTRNRPTSLGKLLEYLIAFYPQTEVVLADGSDSDHAAANLALVQSLASRLRIDHRIYPAEVHIHDRLLDVLRSLPDDLLIMGSDDDFPVIDVLEGLAGFMEAHPDYSTAMGATVALQMMAPGELSATLRIVRPIEDDNPRIRALDYSEWMFATTYAVTRREILIERVRRQKTLFVGKFYDTSVGVTDAIYGKVKAVADVGFFSTANYQHAYVRPEAGLIFLRRSDRVLAITEQIKQDLMTRGRVGEAKAEIFARQIIGAMIRPQIAAPPETRYGFFESAMYNDPVVQGQMQLFDRLFGDDNPVRDRYLPMLRCAVDAMHAVVASDDNIGEQKRSETIEAQMQTSVARAEA